MRAFQDYYDERTQVCYGCGSRNPYGLHIKSYWDGNESICVFKPQPYHTAIEGFVYGGLIASLIDCHSTGTAAAALYRESGLPMEGEPGFRCVTASLHVDYLKPTPIEAELVLRGRVAEISGRRVRVECSLFAGEVETARGWVIAVSVPPNFGL